MRVIVTRPKREAERWSIELSALEFEAVSLPLIQIDPVADPADVVRVWRHLSDYVGVMFVSGNAVEQFFAMKPPNVAAFNVQADARPRAWATGPGTANALLQAGVAARLIDAPPPNAGQFDSEALWQVVAAQVRPGDRVLIVRGTQQVAQSGQSKVKTQGRGRDWFANQVDQMRAQVDLIAAYRRGVPALSSAELELARQAASDGSVWLFSSTEALTNLSAALPGQNWEAAIALATHPRIARVVKNAGFGLVLETRPTLIDVVAGLKRLEQHLKIAR
jgi:uroporphyrinogen-III synthase